MDIQGTFRASQGTFRIGQGTFRVCEEQFGISQGTFGAVERTLKPKRVDEISISVYRNLQEII